MCSKSVFELLGVGSKVEFAMLKNMIFEPTCAICMVGSYASLSVRPSVRLSVWTRPKIRLENNSYLGKYYS